jgi:hypothetical protein
MIVNSTPSLGIDPLTAISLVSKGLDFLGNTFGGPTQQQVLAAEQAAADAERRQIFLGLGLVGGAVLVAVLLAR